MMKIGLGFVIISFVLINVLIYQNSEKRLFDKNKLIEISGNIKLTQNIDIVKNILKENDCKFGLYNIPKSEFIEMFLSKKEFDTTGRKYDYLQTGFYDSETFYFNRGPFFNFYYLFIDEKFVGYYIEKHSK